VAPTRNGDLTPTQIMPASNTKAWWRCEEGHEWEARVDNRTTGGTACPVCFGRTVLAGYNDLVTRSPEVVAQWHPTRNGDLTPDRVTAGNGKKVWWRCEEGHEWEAKIKNRTSRGHGCPVHAGQRLLAGYNDLTTTFPDIAKRWHPTRNGDLTPTQVMPASNAKVWWRCEEGHEWEARVDNRTTGGTGCPTCWQLPAIPRPVRPPDQRRAVASDFQR